MRLSSSRLQVLPCIPRRVPAQTWAILHGELRRLGILLCNQTFQGLFYGCRRCGFLCCRCGRFWSEQVQRLAVCGMVSIGSSKSVETSSGFGSQSVPRTFCTNLWSHRCSSGTMACPSNACRLCDRRAACGRVGEDWNNAQPAKPTADVETPK